MLKKGLNRLFLLINHFLGIDYKLQEEISAKLNKIKSKIELILLNENQSVDDDITDVSSVVILLRIPEISIIFSTLWLIIESDLHNVLIDNRSIYVRFFSSLYRATLEGNDTVAQELFLDKEWKLDENRFEQLGYQSFCSFIYEKLDSWVSMLPESDIILFVIFLFDSIFDYDNYEKHEKIALKESQNIHSVLEFGENMELFFHHFNMEVYYAYPGTLRIKDSVKASLSQALNNLNKIHRNVTVINTLNQLPTNSQLAIIQPSNEVLVTSTVAAVPENSHQRQNHTVIIGQGLTEEPRRNSIITPYTDDDTESRPSSPLEVMMREVGDGHMLEGSLKQLSNTRTRRHAEEVLVDLGIIQNYDTLENIETESQTDMSNASDKFPVVTIDTKPSVSAASHSHPLTDSSMTTNKSRNAVIPQVSTSSMPSDVPPRHVSPSKLIDTGETTINMRMTDPDSLEASLRILSRQSSPKNDSQLYAHLNKKLHNQLQQQRIHDIGRRKSALIINKALNQHTNAILPSVSYSNTSRATSPHSNQPTGSNQASTTKGASLVSDDFYPSDELIHRNLLESDSPNGMAMTISHYNSKELKPYLQRNNRTDPLARLEQQKPTVKLVLRERKGITPMIIPISNITSTITTPANKSLSAADSPMFLPQDSLLTWTNRVLSYINHNCDDISSSRSQDSAAESGIGSDVLSRQRSDVTNSSDLSRSNTGYGSKSFAGLPAEDIERFESTGSRVSRAVSMALSNGGDLLAVDADIDSQAIASLDFLSGNEPCTADASLQSQSLGISITRRDSAGSDVVGPPSAVSNSSHVGKLASFSNASGEESGTPASYLPMEEITSPDISPRIPTYLGDGGVNDTSEENQGAKSSTLPSPNSSMLLQPNPKKVTINDEGVFNENSSVDINSQTHSLQCDLPDGYSWVLKAEMASSTNISVLSHPSGDEGLTRDRGRSQRIDFLPSVMPSWNPARARASRAPQRLFPLSFYNSHIDTSTIRRGVNFGHKNVSNHHHYPKSHSFTKLTERRSISPLPSNISYLTPHSAENEISRPLSPIESTSFLTELVNKPMSEEHPPHTPHSIRKINSQGNLRNGQSLATLKSESGINQSAQSNINNDNPNVTEAAGSEVMLSATSTETTIPGDKTIPLPAATPQSIPFKLSLNKVEPRKSISAASESLTRSSSPIVMNKLETFTKDNIFDLQGKSNPKLTKEKNKKSTKLKPIPQDVVSNTPELFINSVTRPLGSKSLHSLHDYEYLPLSSTATPWPAPSGLHCMETDKLDTRFAWEDRKDLLLHAYNDTGKVTLALKHQKLVKRSFESYVKNDPNSRIHKLEQLRANKPLVLYGMNGG